MHPQGRVSGRCSQSPYLPQNPHFSTSRSLHEGAQHTQGGRKSSQGSAHQAMGHGKGLCPLGDGTLFSKVPRWLANPGTCGAELLGWVL